VGYYAEKMQHKLFSISQEELRPYFPLPRVLDGLFAVAEKLFGVKIVERRDVPVWHADARFFEIHDPHGKVRAGFYLDACARPKKRAGAWMDDCVGRKDFGADHTIPVAYLVCNFLPAAPGKPPLLTHDDVVTMFHEFGHGLHHMLTRVGYPSIAGINGVSWDAVELPSQFMENYAWNADVLRLISGHVDSAAELPESMIRCLQATRTFHAGSLVIPVAQPLAKVAMNLLEPAAPDSFARWGFFNAIFEEKEYGEPYVLEALAREMMATDPALRREFEELLVTDSDFAASPLERLRFFHKRSPYWDPQMNVYPAGRIVSRLDLPLSKS